MRNFTAGSKEIKGWDFQGRKMSPTSIPSSITNSILQLNLMGEKGTEVSNIVHVYP